MRVFLLIGGCWGGMWVEFGSIGMEDMAEGETAFVKTVSRRRRSEPLEGPGSEVDTMPMSSRSFPRRGSGGERAVRMQGRFARRRAGGTRFWRRGRFRGLGLNAREVGHISGSAVGHGGGKMGGSWGGWAS